MAQPGLARDRLAIQGAARPTGNGPTGHHDIEFARAEVLQSGAKCRRDHYIEVPRFENLAQVIEQDVVVGNE
jgi:hypothetical protein